MAGKMLLDAGFIAPVYFGGLAVIVSLVLSLLVLLCGLGFLIYFLFFKLHRARRHIFMQQSH